MAGGWGTPGVVLAMVEVMNTETKQWSTAVNLPEPIASGSLVQVDNEHIYFLGGFEIPRRGKKSVYTCSVSTLLQSCNSKSQGTRSFLPSNTASVWSKIADLPVTYSTCVSLHGRLLVVGGQDSHAIPSSALHMYDPSTNSWQVVSHMATPRYSCYAAVLPDNQLMVVGGGTVSGDIDTVEIATVV